MSSLSRLYSQYIPTHSQFGAGTVLFTIESNSVRFLVFPRLVCMLFCASASCCRRETCTSFANCVCVVFKLIICSNHRIDPLSSLYKRAACLPLMYHESYMIRVGMLVLSGTGKSSAVVHVYRCSLKQRALHSHTVKRSLPTLEVQSDGSIVAARELARSCKIFAILQWFLWLTTK